MSSTAQLIHLKAGDGADAVVEVLLDQGGVIVEGLLQESAIAQILEDVDAALEASDPAMEHINPAVTAFFGPKTRHVSGVASHSPTFASDLLCHPTLLAVCDQVIGPACSNYQLNVGHLLDRGPDSDAQFLHRDEVVWVHLPDPHPEVQVASITALQDFTAALGATRVVPGSHRWPRDRQPEPHEIAVAEMPMGSSVVYLGSTLHGAGANTTDGRRKGLHVSYVVGWLRTEENNTLATPPQIARTLPRRAQELLGYAVHDAIRAGGGYLGVVNQRDPLDLLADGTLGGNEESA